MSKLFFAVSLSLLSVACSESVTDPTTTPNNVSSIVSPPTANYTPTVVQGISPLHFPWTITLVLDRPHLALW